MKKINFNELNAEDKQNVSSALLVGDKYKDEYVTNVSSKVIEAEVFLDDDTGIITIYPVCDVILYFDTFFINDIKVACTEVQEKNTEDLTLDELQDMQRWQNVNCDFDTVMGI